MRRALWETIAELADAVRARTPDTELVRVTGFSLDLPVEIVLRPRAEGVELLGDLPRWRWTSGFDEQQGRLRLRIEEVDGR
jgi:hypothetical protein